MNDMPDYTTYAPDELREAERHIDRQRYPVRHAAIMREIQKRERTAELSPRQDTESYGVHRRPEGDGLAHAVARYLGGRIGFAFCAVFIGLVTQGAADQGNGDLILVLQVPGLGIPVFCTLRGYRRAARNPIKLLEKEGVGASLFLLSIIFTFVDLILIVLIAMNGYC